MSMPGFRAEASLYATSGRYAAAANFGAGDSQVAPQLQGQFDKYVHPRMPLLQFVGQPLLLQPLQVLFRPDLVGT